MRNPLDFSARFDGGLSPHTYGGQSPSFDKGQSGIESGSYSPRGNPICCIGIIILIVLGVILNFIFHLELWLIVVIIVIALIFLWIAAAILN